MNSRVNQALIFQGEVRWHMKPELTKLSKRNFYNTIKKKE
jgi:hypothetical protein